MDTTEKIALLAEIFETDVDEIQPRLVLENFARWDSLTALSFFVMINDVFGKQIPGTLIRRFVTIQDMLDVMGE